MLKAIIFDFDGIIAHTEPIHLEAFREALKDYGLELTEKEYYEKYLAYDDRTLFLELHKDRGLELGQERLRKIMSSKSTYYDKLIEGNIQTLPGAVDFIKSAGAKYPLAIGSGALAEEIEEILEHAGVLGDFKAIVSADETERSKPDPEVFVKALSRINSMCQGKEIVAGECLVIEDSVAGIEAAIAAGMKCLAITNSYPGERLKRANLIKDSLKGQGLEELEALFD